MIEALRSQASIYGGKTLIVGPSHVVRWRNMLSFKEDGRAPQELHFIGFGGAPVWSAKNRAETMAVVNSYDRIVLLVGDFRFGNSICLSSVRPSEIFVDSPPGIVHAAISRENDEWLYNRSKKAIQAWCEDIPNKLTILFWDLLCRQIKDRLEGRHINGRSYRHPTWNLESTLAHFSASAYDLRPILAEPMHEAMKLFIDDSVHPSQIGYEFMTNLIFGGYVAGQAFHLARSDVTNQIIKQVLDCRRGRPGSILLTGRSVFINTLARYFGPGGLPDLARKGIDVVLLDKQLGHPPPDPRRVYEVTEEKKLCIITRSGANEEVSSVFPGNTVQLLGSKRKPLHIIWEASCADVITSRGEVPTVIFRGNECGHNALSGLVRSEHVELGRDAQPTFLGLKLVMDHLF